MGSTRLPGKVMMLINGLPMLQGMLERLHQALPTSALLLATSTHPRDELLATMAESLGIRVFRGSEEDVLDRFASAVAHTSADVVVRLTGDCPLIDPTMVDRALDLFYHVLPDYLSNTLRRTYPRGLDIEIFSRKALEIAAREAVMPKDREHVTTYITAHPEKFFLANFALPEDLSAWRLTVDTEEDAALVRRVAADLKSSCSFNQLQQVLHLHPEWQAINAHVRQKQE